MAGGRVLLLACSRQGGLTDNIPFHEVETVQVVHGLLGIVWAVEHDVRGSLRLEFVARPKPYLANGTVLAEQVVQVSTVYLVVAVVS